MESVIAHAPAKINLVLEVQPLIKGEEKHRLDSIFCTTTLSDTLLFDFVSSHKPFHAEVTIESTDFDVSFINEHDNILTKAVGQFKREYGYDALPPGKLKVRLIKSIPSQAGLGGGSSDAAAMIRMLCWLAQVEPLSQRSLSVARSVGADVPFFLHVSKGGLCARMNGHGDNLVEVLAKPEMPLVLIKPDGGVSTKKAFEAFDQFVTRNDVQRDPEGSGPAAELAAALTAQQGLTQIAALCTNDLEPIARELLPAIGVIKQELDEYPGVLGSSMTGSGSALFALCQDTASSHACMQHFAGKGYWAVVTST